MTGRAVLLVLCLGAAGCQLQPRDAYDAGHRALARGEILRAIEAFDTVPFADPRYPEARLHAAALEHRLQRQLELMLLGMRLRHEWQDEAALAAFEGARDAWSGLGAAAAMVAATRARIETVRRDSLLSGKVANGPDSAPSPAATAPAGESQHATGTAASVQETVMEPAPSRMTASDPSPAAPAAETARRTRGGEAASTATGARQPEPDAGSPARSLPGAAGAARAAADQQLCIPSEPAAGQATEPGLPGPSLLVEQDPAAAVGLASLELKLQAGDLDRVLPELVALHRAYPDDMRIRGRLARLLQQRGLVAYGQGSVVRAIADWRQALELDPALRSARAMLEMATAELLAPVR